MKKYQVSLYYHTSIVVDVEAENEEAAIEEARLMGASDDELLNGMEEDDSPDVYEIK